MQQRHAAAGQAVLERESQAVEERSDIERRWKRKSAESEKV
jgi:hypothetical protein